MRLTPHQAKYIAHDLTLQHAGGGVSAVPIMGRTYLFNLQRVVT